MTRQTLASPSAWALARQNRHAQSGSCRVRMGRPAECQPWRKGGLCIAFPGSHVLREASGGVLGPRRPTESAPDGAHSSWSELQQPGIHTYGRCQLFAFPGAVARLGTHHRVGPSLYPRSTQFSSHIVVSTLNFKKHLR